MEYSVKIVVARVENVEKVWSYEKNRVVAYLKNKPEVVKNCMDGYLKWRPALKIKESNREVNPNISVWSVIRMSVAITVRRRGCNGLAS